MEDIEKKIFWLLLIFPGFLSLSITLFMADIGQVEEFAFVLYSISLTFVNISIAYVISIIFGILFGIDRGNLTSVFASILLVTSLFIGLGLGFAIEKDYLFRALRWAPFTESFNRRSHLRPMIFLFSQNTAGLLDVEGDGRPFGKVGEAWLQIHLDGDIFEGWPEFYSNEESSVYLSPACEIKSKDQALHAKRIPGPGVIIPEGEIRFAVFLDRHSIACYKLWEAAFEAKAE
jgi:hypothetical protein